MPLQALQGAGYPCPQAAGRGSGALGMSSSSCCSCWTRWPWRSLLLVVVQLPLVALLLVAQLCKQHQLCHGCHRSHRLS